MKEINKHLKIKHWHTRNCGIEGTSQERYLPSRMFFGNFAGNEGKQGNHHYWIEFECNNTNCGFLAVVNSDIFNDLIKSPL